MSTWFDETSNRVAAESLAVASQVNTLRDDVGTAFGSMPPVATMAKVTQYVTDTGSANAYAVAMPLTITSYTAGIAVRFIPTNANTGASTLDIDGIGPQAIKRPDGSALVSGDITTAQMIELSYDGTNFVFTGGWPVSYYSQAIAAAAAAASDAVDTAADLVLTNADVVSTNADVVTCGNHKDDAETAQTAAETAQGLAEDAQSYAEEWANVAEDTLVSVAAGGDGATEYSSLHWAAKSAASATTASGHADDAETAQTAAEAALASMNPALYIATAGDTMDGVLNLNGGWQIGGVAVGATAAEIDKLDGWSGTQTDLDYLTSLRATGVTAAEFDYLDGNTGGNIQAQLDTKAPIANPTFTGEIGIGAVNVSETELGILEGATVTTVELNRVDATSSIQTQIDGKANTSHNTPAASISVQGHVELATNAECRTGTDTSRAVTPDGLTYAFEDRSHATSGYQVLPGGLILQWGTGLSGTRTVSFPRAFTTCFNVQLTNIYASSVEVALSISSISAASFSYQTGTSSGVRWFAIGV